jgi:hypothetical protein
LSALKLKGNLKKARNRRSGLSKRDEDAVMTLEAARRRDYAAFLVEPGHSDES